MKNYVLILLLSLLLISSCEVSNDYDCYTFEVRYERTYVPYRPMYYTVTRYDKCGLSSYMAYQEDRSNEYYYTWYDLNGYYVTERQTCTYWRTW